MKNQWLGAREVAKLLNVHRSTLLRNLDELHLPYLRIGNLYRFDPKDVERFLQSRYQKNASA